MKILYIYFLLIIFCKAQEDTTTNDIINETVNSEYNQTLITFNST